MYKIGEFSKLAKTTVKTLRYYEKEGLLHPAHIDESLYRYYTAEQLLELGRIVNLRQMGFSIQDIRDILAGTDVNAMLHRRRTEIEKELASYSRQLSRIDFALEEKNMKYEPVIKELPACTVYYKEGVIRDFSEASVFVLGSAQECLALNPDIQCVEPDYCFVNYLDGEYRDHGIAIRYCQAVTKAGVPGENIRFGYLPAVKAVCIYHRGPYDTLGEAYGFVMKYVEENGYNIAELPRERYIDGVWNKEDPEEWLTEIQVPVE